MKFLSASVIGLAGTYLQCSQRPDNAIICSSIDMFGLKSLLGEGHLRLFKYIGHEHQHTFSCLSAFSEADSRRFFLKFFLYQIYTQRNF